MCVCVYSVLSDSCDPVDCRAPLSMGFSRQEYWSGLPFPTPGFNIFCKNSINVSLFLLKLRYRFMKRGSSALWERKGIDRL